MQVQIQPQVVQVVLQAGHAPVTDSERNAQVQLMPKQMQALVLLVQIAMPALIQRGNVLNVMQDTNW